MRACERHAAARVDGCGEMGLWHAARVRSRPSPRRDTDASEQGTLCILGWVGGASSWRVATSAWAQREREVDVGLVVVGVVQVDAEGRANLGKHLAFDQAILEPARGACMHKGGRDEAMPSRRRSTGAPRPPAHACMAGLSQEQPADVAQEASAERVHQRARVPGESARAWWRARCASKR